MKKRYTLKDNKTGTITEYSKLQWDIAWILVYISGIIIGVLIF